MFSLLFSPPLLFFDHFPKNFLLGPSIFVCLSVTYACLFPPPLTPPFRTPSHALRPNYPTQFVLSSLLSQSSLIYRSAPVPACFRTPSLDVRPPLACCHCDLWPADRRVVGAVFGVAKCGHWHFPYLGNWLSPLPYISFRTCTRMFRTPSLDVRTPLACLHCDLWPAERRVVVAVFGVANCGHRHFPYLGYWLSLCHLVYPTSQYTHPYPYP